MDPAGIPLGDMQPMVQTRKLLIEGGLHMANWFVNTPVCCPSRSEYLSGRYAHNIRDNHFENSFDCDDYNLSAPITCGCMRMNSTIDSFENAHYGNLLLAREDGESPFFPLLQALLPVWDCCIKVR